MISVIDRWNTLAAKDSWVPAAALDALWAELSPVRAQDILGDWKGAAFQTGHALCRHLAACRWHGKSFLSLAEAKPLVCRAEDGSLFSNVELGRGEASLWDIEFRGEVTATMVYDGSPIFDHFKQLNNTTLMGIMNGRPDLVLSGGEHFYFRLERD